MNTNLDERAGIQEQPAVQQKDGLQKQSSAPAQQEQSKSTKSGASKRRNARKRRAKARKKLYEVDSAATAPGLVPVEAFLPGWVAPKAVKAKNKKLCMGVDMHIPTHIAPLKTQECGVLKQRILQYVEQAQKPLAATAIAADLDVTIEKAEFAINELVDDRELFRSRKNRVGTASQMGLHTGKLQVTSNGFAFVLLDKGDLYISAKKLSGAINGDEVIAKVIGERAGNREGEIVTITKRANAKIIGVVDVAKNKSATLIPDDKRHGIAFPIPRNELRGAKHGQKVVCDINYKPVTPCANVSEILGFSDDKGTDILSIIRKHNIVDKFLPQTVRAAKRVPQEVLLDDILRREDLRKTMLFTIDGADAKDFDDAVSLEMLQNGNYYLGVHIADVAHYVKEGGAIDNEAVKRATSVYFADRVIPMLPTELSNGICSLNPKQDRLALSCFMEIDAKGVVVNHRISETVIHSKYRMIYEDVSAILQGDKTLRKTYRPIVKTLEKMMTLSLLLRERRTKRGALDFDFPESKIILDENGKAVDIRLYERGESNKMIEDFMLACNETVAEHMAYLERPMVYRVHEIPTDEKVLRLNTFLQTFGVRIRGNAVELKPKSLQSVLQSVKGKPEELAISQMTLRSLQKARYCEENLGHFGLAAQFYCHFTSPIRRYPDLEVHRIIKAILHASLGAKKEQELASTMPALAAQCSERERAAMEAERDVDDLKKCEYMAGHIGEVYEGMVSGMMGGGVFVLLPNTCEGMIKCSALGDDYFEFDEKRFCFVGRSTNEVIRLGDHMKVRVESANLSTHRVEFSIYGQEPRGRHPRKARK